MINQVLSRVIGRGSLSSEQIIPDSNIKIMPDSRMIFTAVRLLYCKAVTGGTILAAISDI